MLYSDGVSEANSPAGNELGRDGLMNMVRALDIRSANGFGTQLVSALNNYRGGGEPVDDQTINVIRRMIFEEGTISVTKQGRIWRKCFPVTFVAPLHALM